MLSPWNKDPSGLSTPRTNWTYIVPLYVAASTNKPLSDAGCFECSPLRECTESSHPLEVRAPAQQFQMYPR